MNIISQKIQDTFSKYVYGTANKSEITEVEELIFLSKEKDYQQYADLITRLAKKKKMSDFFKEIIDKIANYDDNTTASSIIDDIAIAQHKKMADTIDKQLIEDIENETGIFGKEPPKLEILIDTKK